MTPFSTEDFVAAQKSSIDTFLAYGTKALEGVERMAALQLQAARTALTDAADHSQALLSAKTPQDVLTQQTAFVQPLGEKALAYGRQGYEIASALQAEFAKLMEAGYSDAQQKVAATIEVALKNAPAGTENAAALVKSAMAATNTAIESVQKAAKQAVTMAEANFDSMSQTAATTAKAATAKARRAA